MRRQRVNVECSAVCSLFLPLNTDQNSLFASRIKKFSLVVVDSLFTVVLFREYKNVGLCATTKMVRPNFNFCCSWSNGSCSLVNCCYQIGCQFLLWNSVNKQINLVLILPTFGVLFVKVNWANSCVIFDLQSKFD